ncbi:E3 ubiquitin-protein ligase At1g63170-like isoform X2 [Salvia hispanica]|uniref:E3 ubiquitin-protein ligase At1g63170-like isoform X2 n=1 Tax=Salvia hispanica TaxID=49212 RepID=UPI002009A9E9|nr:E3 ubiquitin-protein ligase At1g63170-like isoform X2 [Salvia hispanica]
MSFPPDSPSPAAVDTTPLLSDQIFRPHRRPRFLRRPPSLRGAANFLRRASSRSRAMREPSVRVREAAADQIEERQSDWAYSKPIVILDLVWNISFVVVSISVLIVSRNETPSMPLRLWTVGYALQCLLHAVCVCWEYKKRYSGHNLEGGDGAQLGLGHTRNYSNSSSGSDDVESDGYFSDHRQSNDEASVAKHLESANTMFSFIWWLIGFYWVSAGGQSLPSEAPQLYWLCITFLAFDVFFVVVCVAVACVIGLAVCCCLPCIIAILYAVADQEGATKDDIERLPKYKFRRIGDLEKRSGEIQGSFGGIMTECDTDSPIDHVLPLEDAECCICLCDYDDGSELRELPCAHHFHVACIDKWLYMNATCPLCKLNIIKNGNLSGSEEA